MGPYEIQQLLGITRSTFRDTVQHPEFPELLDATIRRGAVWYEAEIMEWVREYRPNRYPLAEDPESD
jgi:predicted DNA-binding transcriptional regulator AlpA